MDIKRLLRKEMPAPLWKRGVAYVVDALILSFVLWPLQPADLSFTSLSDFYSRLISSTLFTLQFMVVLVLITVLSLAYWSVLEYRFHQTLGKYFLRIAVRSEMKTLTFYQCFLRNVAKLSSVLLFLDSLYMLFTHSSQRYTETLAKTEVIQLV